MPILLTMIARPQKPPLAVAVGDAETVGEALAEGVRESDTYTLGGTGMTIVAVVEGAGSV